MKKYHRKNLFDFVIEIIYTLIESLNKDELFTVLRRNKVETVKVVGLISNIREKSAQFINSQLKEKGVEGPINSHGTILSILYDHDGKITMNEIGKIIGKKKSTLTDLVRKLTELGYITREKSEKDSRVIEISLTEKGWQFKTLFEEISDNLLEKTYKDFTQEEKETLVLLLNKIRKNYQK